MFWALIYGDLKPPNIFFKSQDNNQGFMQRNSALMVQMDHSTADSRALDAEVHEFQDMITTLREQLEEAKEDIAFKEEEIENLQQKLALTSFGDTQDIIHSANNGIAHMVNNQTLTMSMNDWSSLTGLSHQQSLRALKVISGSFHFWC